jgi:hypothetical protein
MCVPLYKVATHSHKSIAPVATMAGHQELSRAAIRNATKIMDVAIFSAVVTSSKFLT